MAMVRSHELRVIKELESPTGKGVNDSMTDKLILDQPEIITNEGAVEHHLKPKTDQSVRPIHDATAIVPVSTPQPADTLLVEDPLEGVDILID
jgi:hypothetical protein